MPGSLFNEVAGLRNFQEQFFLTEHLRATASVKWFRVDL